MTVHHDTARAALGYVERGWAVVPLHDVVGGHCSCGSADPKHHYPAGGKHPLYGGWQNAGIRDPRVVAEQWAARPGANVGIVTGRASGIWVLDVDPDNGGDRQLAGLVASFGVLPETYTVATGSGGRHYYWIMPDFEFTTSRGQLPLGLDVRGNAGQVVAPPSVTLKGPYAVLVDPGHVVDAPGWLLSMIRPPERIEVVESPWAGQAVHGPAEASGALDRGPAYARKAVEALLAQMAGAGVGERNSTAARVTRRLVELVNSPWSGLGDGSEVWAAYLAACAHCDVDGGFSQSEAGGVLSGAWRALAGRGAELPAPDHLGTWMPWVPPLGGGSDFDQAGQGPAGHETSTQVAGSAPWAGDPGYEAEVSREMGRLVVREEARRRLTERDRTRRDFDAELLDDDGLAALPPPVALVTDWLYVDTLARMNGPSGEGKSFVAMELAACVANGVAWHGRPVTRGTVLYVVAEGASGANQRFAAWRERFGVPRHHVKVLTAPVQSLGPDWTDFVAWCGRLAPALIVLDTQARHTEGVNENDASEMGLAIGAWEALRAATGACVLLVHHRGKTGTLGRGSTAVRGAMSTEMDVSKVGPNVTVRVTKQKDAAEALPLLLTLNPLGGSAVLVGPNESLDADPTHPFVAPTVAPLALRDQAAVAIAQALLDLSGSGATKSEAFAHARTALGWDSTDAVRQNLRKGWARLQDLGRIAKALGREAHFFIELEGVSALGANPDKAVQGGPEVYIPV